MTEVLFEKPTKKKKWWKTNRGLIIILLMMICMVLGGYTYYLTVKFSGDFCTTPACLKASVRFLSSIDESVDPCDDFYKFSCGKFIKDAYETNNPSPQLVQKKRLNNQLNAIIALPITGEEWTPLLLQKQFYQTCMNESAIDDDQNETLMRLIKEIGGWPVVEGQEWIFEDFELDAVMVKCKELGLPFQWFFKIGPTESVSEIQIHLPDVNTHFNEPFKEAVYLNLMIETAAALGGSRILSQNELEKALEFEKHLFELVKKYKHVESSVINHDDLEIIFSNNDLSLLVEELIDDVFPFSENTTVRVDEDFMKELNLLMAGTARRTYANYFIWKIIEDFSFFLESPIRQNFVNFSNLIVDSENQVRTRSDVCLKEAKKRFPNVAETFYVKKYSDNDTIRNVKEMVGNIKDILISRIDEAYWISNDSKIIAKNKIESVLEIIGDNHLPSDSTELSSSIGNLTGDIFSTDNIIDMTREKNINDFKMKFLLDRTRVDELNRSIFDVATKVNAGYMDLVNIIVISPGIMQDLFYSKERPNYLNYGGLGIVIGHELAHGYEQYALAPDWEGQEIMANATFNETTEEVDLAAYTFEESPLLWDNDTMEEITARSMCITDQYKSFYNREEDVTLSENFADLLGIDVAYEAYVAWWKIHGNEEKLLPGLSYNPKQLFWIQYATEFCFAKIDTSKYDLQNAEHAPFIYRVVSPLKNSRNFPLDFQCPPGSNMNPVEKCFIF